MDFYYGKQQSSRSVADSAGELKTEIERILEETGAEKVNIVAHSKGGLDARYAITHLGLADRVASLTTINTPHRGCKFADVLLGAFPKWLVNFVAARYNSLFHRLGDPAPDFLAGVNDLTAASCAALNAGTPEPGISAESGAGSMQVVSGAAEEAAEALTALGYARSEAMKAVHQAGGEEGMDSSDVQALLSGALRYLG